MKKKNSGLSGIATFLIAIFLIVRIGMIASRDSSNSTHSSWNSTYLIWSVILLIIVIGAYFWNQNKKSSEEE